MASIETVHMCPSGHVLKLMSFKNPYTCGGCKVQGYGPRYECESCNYNLHDSCLLTSATASHPFFPNDTILVFLKDPPEDRGRRRCDICAQEICGFNYHDFGDEDGWDLHPCCLHLKPEFEAEGIKFQLQKAVKSNCMWCNKGTLKESAPGVRGCSYVSKCKKYHFHVRCVMENVLDVLKRQEASETEHVRLQLHTGRNKKRHSKYISKIMLVILKTVASILIGDPVAAAASFLSELVLN